MKPRDPLLRRRALLAPAGICTVITALFMGPLITFFRRTVSEPLLAGGRKAT